MPSIHSFSAKMNHNFARPNTFKVKVSGPSSGKTTPNDLEQFQHSCFQAQIPGNNILTTEKDIGFRSVAYQKAFGDVILGFYVGGDLKELQLWKNWIDNIVDPQTNQYKYYTHYIGDIEITHLNRAGASTATWKLHDAYPKQVDPIQLDYGTNDAVMTCNVTITYRHFTMKPGPEEFNEEGQILATHSVRTDMNTQHDMMEILDKNENWKFGNEGISSQEFFGMYPNWNTMNLIDRQAAMKLYGITGRHGDSPVGGAGKHIND